MYIIYIYNYIRSCQLVAECEAADREIPLRRTCRSDADRRHWAVHRSSGSRPVTWTVVWRCWRWLSCLSCGPVLIVLLAVFKRNHPKSLAKTGKNIPISTISIEEPDPICCSYGWIWLPGRPLPVVSCGNPSNAAGPWLKHPPIVLRDIGCDISTRPQVASWTMAGRRPKTSALCMSVCLYVCVFVYSVYSVCVYVPPLSPSPCIHMYTRRCKFSCSILCLFNYINIYIYNEKIYVVQYSMICIILYDNHKYNRYIYIYIY